MSVQKLFMLSLLMLCCGVNASEVKFRFPIAEADRHLIMGVPVIGMDHDHLHGTNKAICKNYRGAGFPFCYNDHEGTDFMLAGGFYRMDRGSARVVAAAAGVVVEVHDGEYDRCQADLKTKNVSCGGRELLSNFVVIEHENGVRTRYHHLKKNSIVVWEGKEVGCGELLGKVGSSGISSAPHLHFDVIDEDGVHRDPYRGKNSQNFSYWQKEFMNDGLPSGSCQAPSQNMISATFAASCFYQSIQDASICGSVWVTDAFICGTQAVACGQELVNCGTKWVTSAAQCGSSIIDSVWTCFQNGFGLVGSCSVPKTCQINVQCQVTKYCDVAKSCTLPKTCSIFTCQ